MAIFRYQAKNINGNIINGQLEATTKQEVVQNLRERQYYPILIEIDSKSNAVNMEFLTKITVKDLSMFCRSFGFILQSGTPILRGLELSMQQCNNKRLKELLRRVHDQVQRGRNLSDALKFEEEIPELMVNMIAAGEASGKLDYILDELSIYYEKMYKQKQKVSQATMYPKVVVVFAIVVVGFLMIKIVPTFVSQLTVAGGQIPLVTKMLVSLSNILAKSWLIIILILLIAYAIKVYYLEKDPKYQENSGKRRLQGKIFGAINKQIIAGRFANTFCILNNSGMGVIQSLEITAKVMDNPYVEKKLIQAKEDIKRGNPIGKTIEDIGIFPPMLTQMITIGEETGTMDDILKKTSEFYDGEVEVALQKMVSTIEPMLIVGLAGIVLFIVLALLLPMMGMMDAVNNMPR